MVKGHSDSERGNRCRHMGYYFRLTARVLLYAPSHRQDNTYHGLCYISLDHWLERIIAQWVHPMKDRSDDPSHHELTLLPRSYISLPYTEQNVLYCRAVKELVRLKRPFPLGQGCPSYRASGRTIFSLVQIINKNNE